MKKRSYNKKNQLNKKIFIFSFLPNYFKTKLYLLGKFRISQFDVNNSPKIHVVIFIINITSNNNSIHMLHILNLRNKVETYIA